MQENKKFASRYAEVSVDRTHSQIRIRNPAWTGCPVYYNNYRCPVVIRLSLVRRLVNLLPVAQRTNAFTNGVVGRTMGRWS